MRLKELTRELTQNLSLKLFSLFVAVLLFLFVSVESSTAVDVEYNIEYQTAEDIMVTSDAPSKLVATLKGPWATIRTFGHLDPVVVDLIDAEPGTVRFRIDTTDVDAPAGMKVVSIRPSEIELSLDRRVEKLVAVEVDPLGRPAFGYEIVEMRSEPARVRVEGPMSKIRTLDFVHTRPVSLRDRTEELSVEVEIRPPSPPLRLVGRNTVTVFVDISEETMQRDFEAPVRLQKAPDGAEVEPNTVYLTLKGPRRILDRLRKDAFIAVVDVASEVEKGLRSFKKEVRLQPELPERTQALGSMPQVQVKLGSRRRRNAP